jgi:hypothetical protein
MVLGEETKPAVTPPLGETDWHVNTEALRKTRIT